MSFFVCYDIIILGDKMKIAVDKKSYQVAKDDGNKYIYLYDDEPLEQLMATKLHCMEYNECEFVDINTTDYNIDCIKKCKITDKDWDKLPEYVEYKIGIIVPNYNYEHTIEKCLDSIFNQTYKNYEIIFVDDMSTDNSVDIALKTYDKYLEKRLEAFEKQNKKVEIEQQKLKIVQLKQKRLNGGARNEAYLHLSDDVDYVYYVDSDDWLYNEDALLDINRKLQSKPDVLFVQIMEYKNGKTKVSDIPEYKDKYEAIAGWSGSCGKVIKKSLATRQECLYNEGTLKEDKNQHCKICFYMNSFQLLKKPIYVWNKDNYKSVTTIRTINPLWETSTIRHWADTLQLYLELKGKDEKIDKFLESRLEMVKKEVLEGGDRQW